MEGRGAAVDGRDKPVQKLPNATASLTAKCPTAAAWAGTLPPGLPFTLNSELPTVGGPASRSASPRRLRFLPRPPILFGDSGVRAQDTPVPSGESACELAAGPATPDRPSVHCFQRIPLLRRRFLCPPPCGREPLFTWGFSSLEGGPTGKHPGALQPRPLPSHRAMTEAGSLTLGPQ